LIKTKISK